MSGPDDEYADPDEPTRAEELAEELDIPLETAERIAREEGDEEDASFVGDAWLRTGD
jgi:hypothetical protein